MKSHLPKSSETLFALAKSIPTELSAEQMNGLIDRLPELAANLPIDKTKYSFFKLKYIVMITIPLLVGLGLLLPTSNPVTFTDLPLAPLPSAVSTIESKELKSTEFDITTPQETIIVKMTTSESAAKKPDEILVIDTDQTVNIIETELSGQIVNQEKNKINNQSFFHLPTLIAPPKMEALTIPIPDLSGWKMRRLKRALYKQLRIDGLIAGKYMVVEIALLPDHITVNKKTVPDHLLLKYLKLTEDVGTGPNRKIKMSREYILAGDFTAEGFKGNGVGTFHEKMIGGGSPLFSEFTNKRPAEDALKTSVQREQRQLDEFCETILVERPRPVRKKYLFGPNMNKVKPTELHQTLKKYLKSDAFLNDSIGFALIELPKDAMYINGQPVNGALYQKYRKLFDDHHIKSGNQRMIRWSPHTIRVGDFIPGEFTGISESFE